MKYNRIYINSRLAENSKLELAGDHVHYVKTVLRLKVNDGLRIFNGMDGEFLAQITDIGKHNLSVRLKEQLKKPYTESTLILAISIIKQDKLMLAINMATQLGITKIIPLITRRCQFRSVNIERLTKCVIEATEQSERLTPPIIEKAITIQDYLKKNNNLMLYANEHEKEENSILRILSSLSNIYSCEMKRGYTKNNLEKSKESVSRGAERILIREHLRTYKDDVANFSSSSSITIIVGPEGGFTNDELELLASYKNTKSISLGSNILRAETAAITAIAQVRLWCGSVSVVTPWFDHGV
ncbi:MULTISPECIES: 16S rRNA (uracil(1498)-N(3))-methyltransferase [spotted fever group]|uniref:Ribosomal RNA small subunit methyltransferase E n=1 Tax=Rickettsia tamurae subsp. buchneri TaxID=1462938 RepID=A0A8E0WLK1_9RICK|nr:MULTISPECIES: 16S rRNA (uracil(1498)-N(3))-methyltransferase [spotted fever group]EER22813.1 ribosomal RNA small subunit methyltransferase E [Rickettsia endosymbiont of Ixodes scapularis]KDO02517.1 Ribosomal RNA small subunit methyltransferase E [Rickettsia tamurae subsp. buchneri]